MDSNYHLKLQLANELREAIIVKNVNEELLEQLSSSLMWLIRYSEKYHVALPESDKIVSLIEKAQRLLGEIYPTPNDEHRRRTPDDRTEPQMVTAMYISLKRNSVFLLRDCSIFFVEIQIKRTVLQMSEGL